MQNHISLGIRRREPAALTRRRHPALIETFADTYDNALMECVVGHFRIECTRTTVFHPGPCR